MVLSQSPLRLCEKPWRYEGRVMAKITGIGGVFFKSKGDPAALAAWYRLPG
jgi:hypothetical protein